MKLQIISVEDFEHLRKDKAVILLDLREKEAYDKAHIEGAVWADWETLEEKIETILPEDKKEEKEIVMYCDKGNTSLLMVRDLGRLGYHVISLGGGYKAWEYYQEGKLKKLLSPRRGNA